MPNFEGLSVEALPPSEDLPDPFTTFAGREIESLEDWNERRRNEILELFQYFVYGHVPEAPTLDVTTETTEGIMDGAATLREAELAFEEYPDAPTITLALFLPADRDGEVPTFLGANAGGNHAVVDDDAVTITDGWRPDEFPQATEDARGAMADYWAVETVLDRGYGFGTFHVSDVEPDDPDVDGIRAHVEQDVPEGTEWGCIAAWAWGYQRGVDYLMRDEDVYAAEVCAIGHSRLGKATLLAGAMDERIAVVVPHQSGTGGMALSRDNDQETVEDITESFPHWFNDVFPRFAGREERLPVDQHLLTTLVAPRHLLDTAGIRDEWTNYWSALRNLRAADEVYDFLGVEGLGEDEVLIEEPIDPDRVGSLLQYRLDTEHTLNADYWEAILDFTDAAFEPEDWTP